MMVDASKIFDFCKRKKYIFCYGAGVYGRNLVFYLKSNGIDIDAFIVSDSREMQYKLGYKVLLLSEYMQSQIYLHEDSASIGIFIAASEDNRREIKRNIEKLEADSNIFEVDEKLILEVSEKIKFERLNVKTKNKTVLLYHRVIDAQDDIYNIKTPVEVFEKHIEYLDSNYKVGLYESDANLVITFDDGYIDNLINADPVLKKYGIRAHLFIASDALGDNFSFWWDELWDIIRSSNIPHNIIVDDHELTRGAFTDRESLCKAVWDMLLNMCESKRMWIIESLKKQLGFKKQDSSKELLIGRKELLQMDRGNVWEIGAHTRRHTNLPIESLLRRRSEILGSKLSLENILERKINSFSYPYGAFDGDDIKFVKESGFDIAFSISRSWEKEPRLSIRRIPIYGNMDVNGLRYIINKSICECDELVSII